MHTDRMKPNVLVFSGYGLNCEEETAFAFRLVGATVDIVHINDLISLPKKLRRYQILAIPGGFSYGDDTGAGRAFAQKLHHHLGEAFSRFIDTDRLVIGICNGFQILVALGFVFPGAALLTNDSGRYTARWVDCRVENKTPWLAGIRDIRLPIAHGEGKLYGDVTTLHVAIRYASENPTGTLDRIAGLINKKSNVLGLMPHPERAVFFTQLPDWTFRKENRQREGKRAAKYGPGLKVFQNAVRYFL